MAISKSMLPEFDHEMANTRKTLERVPDDKLDWKPHDKSMSIRQLATHLLTIPTWAVLTINQDSVDVAPPGGEPLRAIPANSRAEVLQRFDRNAADARAAIEGASDEHLFGNWSLLQGGHTIFTMPRVACLRGFVMNHMIHHRAQLGVYLRLNDIPVPALYGPTADEG